MKDWFAKLAVYLVLVYIFLLGNNYAWAGDAPNFDLQQFKPIPTIENLASLDSGFKENKKEDWRRFHQIIKGTDKLDGLFTLYRAEDSSIYLEIKPEQLNKNYLGTVTLESGIGESGIYSGMPLQDFVFYFRRVNNYLHFVVRNVKFRTEPDYPEQRSLDRSFSDSVLYAIKIASIDSHTKTILINLEDLLIQDFPGLISLLKQSLHADYRFEDNQSYFTDIKTFPLNLEIDSVYGFSSLEGADLVTLADSRALSLKVHYSFSQLPQNNDYIPRLADDRVGYFITAYQNFSEHNRSEPFIRYINRWHLEPSNPDAPLSLPKKPIVFWIENAVPIEYRDAIREGVLMWNKAFTKAGLENAVEVRQMPDDADWHPADVRYNTIRWFNSIDAFFAKAPARVNPFTGEILDADIIVDANMVRSIQQEYRTIIAAQGCRDGENSNNQELSRYDIKGKDEICYGKESSQQAAMGALALSLLQEVTLSNEEMHNYVYQYLRSLIAHEVGHALGLRHNFQGSTMLSPQELNNTEITHSKGLVGSVMDYLPVNLAPQGVKQGDYFPAIVGPYDEWAIAYGYKLTPDRTFESIIPEAEKPFLEEIAKGSPHAELAYATDEDIWDINPDANLWDMSSDVLIYSQWQMDNARFMWHNLEQHHSSKPESYSDLRSSFNRILNYYFLNANLLTKYIGGQSFQRNSANNANGWAFIPVTLEKQRQALKKLQTYIFAEDAFSFSPQLLNRLAPSRWRHWGNPVPMSRLDYPIHDRILMLQGTILRSLLDGDRLHRLQDIELKSLTGQAMTMPELFNTLQQDIWTEVLEGKQANLISSIRRSLQREYLNIMLQMVLRTANVPGDGQTLAWYELRQLQKAINANLKKQGENFDLYTKAHLEEASARITKALNAELRSF